jgi:AcrR family transcriptional regulator
VPFTSDRKQQFLDLFRSHPELKGCRALCAEAVGVSITTLYDHLKRDPEFAEAFEDALQAFIDENMFAPALKRARDGVERPIIGGKFKDEIITYERVYSDSLMAMMLRAHRAEFKDGKDAASMTASGTGGVLIVPGAPATIHDWQNQFGDLARGTVGRPTGEGS